MKMLPIMMKKVYVEVIDYDAEIKAKAIMTTGN
jgi:hypothetical protein